MIIGQGWVTLFPRSDWLLEIYIHLVCAYEDGSPVSTRTGQNSTYTHFLRQSLQKEKNNQKSEILMNESWSQSISWRTLVVITESQVLINMQSAVFILQ